MGVGVAFLALLPVYLVGTLPDERGELGHHHVHALQTGSFQFEDLLFHDGLEGQVGGEQPRSESAVGKETRCCVGGGRGVEKKQQQGVEEEENFVSY